MNDIAIVVIQQQKTRTILYNIHSRYYYLYLLWRVQAGYIMFLGDATSLYDDMHEKLTTFPSMLCHCNFKTIFCDITPHMPVHPQWFSELLSGHFSGSSRMLGAKKNSATYHTYISSSYIIVIKKKAKGTIPASHHTKK